MLIIEVKDSESIERAIKRYKRKHQKTGVLKEMRRRRYFTKPSVARRNEIQQAIYREQKFKDE